MNGRYLRGRNAELGLGVFSWWAFNVSTGETYYIKGVE